MINMQTMSCFVRDERNSTPDKQVCIMSNLSRLAALLGLPCGHELLWHVCLGEASLRSQRWRMRVHTVALIASGM